jgi:hypothetical protein
MTRMIRGTWVRALGGVAVCGALLVACGGSSTSDGTGGSGTGGSAGATGGAGGAGGATGGAGGVTGGAGGVTGGAGGVTGGAGGVTGGAGGAGGVTGGAGGVGGAGGQASCGPEAKKCAEPADCVLNTPSCCVCGMPELSDFEAINKAFTQQCACQGPACGCATMLNPNLAATCTASKCEAFDVRKVAAYSGCQSDTDCTLRMGLDCCESCQSNEWGLVAVKTDGAALMKALCGSGPVACPACSPVYPANKKAACIANQCQVANK